MARAPWPQRGLSMIEMMCAVVIALIGTVVIFQVFQVNESIRRETTSGADTQTSGLVALTTIERDLRVAGFAFNEDQAIGCEMRMYDAKHSPNDVPPFQFVPVRIVANNGTTPDVLQLMMGSPSSQPGPVSLTDDVAAGTSYLPLQVENSYGFETGDLALVWQTGKPCTLVEVTKVVGNALEHLPGSYFSTLTQQNKIARFNKAGGVALGFSALGDATQVSNLGANPARIEYTVRNDQPSTPHLNNQLVVRNDFLENPELLPVADQIVQFKAQYGLDDGVPNGTVPDHVWLPNDGLVDKFTETSPTADRWHQVIAVRVAIVSRSPQPAKPDTSAGACTLTPDWGSTQYPVVWARSAAAPRGLPIDVRTTPDWRCFRYRVFETTVPLRNMIWKGR